MSKTQVITGVERRRRFSDEEKARIVAEIADTSLSSVGRKYGISLSALSNWKKLFPAKSFALVQLHDEEAQPVSLPKIPPATQNMNVIRVVVQQRIVVEFPLASEPDAIARFIKALEA